ncbi:MAG: flagellin [Verrucomicrobiota bacterium]
MTTIGTNIGALNASFYLGQNTEALQKNMIKLSAGSRLANPAEDAAGVAVSGKLDANVKRLVAASEGAQNIISFAQTSDGFLKTIQEQLTRMSELAQRATNGAFGSADRANYNIEFTKLRDQIGTVLSSAKFNGETLFQVNTSIAVAISAQGDTDVFSKVSVTNLTNLGINASTIGTTTVAISAIASLNNALSTIATKRAEVNADISKFNFHIQNIRTERINVEAANSRIKDLDVASESTQLAKNNILIQASTAMLAQANVSQQNVLSLLR